MYGLRISIRFIALIFSTPHLIKQPPNSDIMLSGLIGFLASIGMFIIKNWHDSNSTRIKIKNRFKYECEYNLVMIEELKKVNAGAPRQLYTFKYTGEKINEVLKHDQRARLDYQALEKVLEQQQLFPESFVSECAGLYYDIKKYNYLFNQTRDDPGGRIAKTMGIQGYPNGIKQRIDKLLKPSNARADTDQKFQGN